MVAWLFSLPMVAQNFSIRGLNTQQQLPVATVHCVMQDSEGYMWYGTEGGLCRDNGYQIDLFRPEDTDRQREAYQVNAVVENGEGDIVFGTAYGLYIIHKQDYQVRSVSLDSEQHFIESLFVDSRQHLWVGCRGMFFECEGNGEVIERFPSLIAGKPAAVTGIAEGSDGTIYVPQWRSGILRRRKGEKGFSPLRWPLAATPLRLIEDAGRRCFWVLTSGAGVQCMTIEGDECRLTAQRATLGDNERNHGLSMIQDLRRGLFWTATQGDLYAYCVNADGVLQEVPTDGWLPAGKKILDQLCLDRDGNIYVAGFTPPTFIITAEQSDIVRRVTPAISRETGFPLLADRTVHERLRVGNGTSGIGDRYVWIWQGRKGLLLYDSEEDDVQALPWKPNRNIKPCSKGGIWAFNDTHVSHLWQQEGKIAEEKTVSVPAGEQIRNIHESRDGMLWIATERKLYRMSVESRVLNFVGQLPDAPLSLDSDKRGMLYLAIGKEGLYVGDVKDGVRRMDNLEHETFLSVATMDDGSVWTSTHEGHVYHYLPEDGTWELEPRLTSPNRAAVKCVCTDALGHVWAMTDQLVCEFAPVSRAYRLVRNTDRQVDVSYFYALEQMDPTHICIDGAGALIEIQSSAELNAQRAAAVSPRVSSAVVNGEVRLISKDQRKLRLAADEVEVTLRLTTLDHLHASTVCFAYQVEGIHREWVYLPQGMNTLLLSNLPKGSRRVQVIASDRNGCWSEPTVLLVVERAPHWWETWWAYLLYLGVLVAAIYGVWRVERRIHVLRRLIHRRQLVRLDEIEMKREDIADQQRDDEFLRRAIAKTEEHLSEPDYNVEALSADMCMSRITFYRRIQEQTGQTPTDFIRDIRMKKAAQLLTQHPDASVSDIARKVGFATPKYFSKCFKEKFGVLPKDYRDANP